MLEKSSYPLSFNLSHENMSQLSTGQWLPLGNKQKHFQFSNQTHQHTSVPSKRLNLKLIKNLDLTFNLEKIEGIREMRPWGSNWINLKGVYRKTGFSSLDQVNGKKKTKKWEKGTLVRLKKWLITKCSQCSLIYINWQERTCLQQLEKFKCRLLIYYLVVIMVLGLS